MDSESELLGVRFVGPSDTLQQVQQAASTVGWSEVQHDQQGSIILLSPKPYHLEQFTKLIDAVDALPVRNFSLQLIGPAGKPVNLGPPDNAN